MGLGHHTGELPIQHAERTQVSHPNHSLSSSSIDKYYMLYIGGLKLESFVAYTKARDEPRDTFLLDFSCIDGGFQAADLEAVR
jgi:hypothetical protein